MTTAGRFDLPPLDGNIDCDSDRCAAPATLRIILKTGDIYLCGHHYSVNGNVIRQVAVYVQDSRCVPRSDTSTMERPGRMTMNRALTHHDRCRGCGSTLTNRRVFIGDRNINIEYFLCDTCDLSAAVDMESLKGLGKSA